MATSRQRIGFSARSAPLDARTLPVRAQHERGLAAFVAPRRREHFLRALDDPRRRLRLHEELHRFEHQLDPRWARPLRGRGAYDDDVAGALAALRDAGAPATCFVLAYGELDGRQLPLRLAVRELLWVGSGLASCLPGRLGLYAGEDGTNVFLLARDA